MTVPVSVVVLLVVAGMALGAIALALYWMYAVQSPSGARTVLVAAWRNYSRSPLGQCQEGYHCPNCEWHLPPTVPVEPHPLEPFHVWRK